MAAHARHRILRPLFALLLAGIALAGFTGTAHAADGYRYWNYFHVENGAYAFAETGAGDVVPEDGGIEAYRYGTSSTAEGVTPRADLNQVDFAAVCGAEEAAAGEKRVAVLIDYGTAADAADGETPPAPRGACAVVPEGANGAQVLGAVADVRIEKSLTCGIDGYPIQTCSVTVPDAAPADVQPVPFDLPADAGETVSSDAAPDSSSSDLLWPLIGVGLLVVLIAAISTAMNRRNKTSA